MDVGFCVDVGASSSVESGKCSSFDVDVGPGSSVEGGNCSSREFRKEEEVWFKTGRRQKEGVEEKGKRKKLPQQRGKRRNKHKR